MLHAKIVIGRKTDGDLVVTSKYLNVIKSAFTDAGIKCSLAKKNEIISKNDILIFDECKVAFKYTLKGYKNIFVWIQGVVPEEALMQGYSMFRYYIHSLIECIVLKKSKLIFFCSKSMKKHYEAKYNLKKLRYIIMPCYNESQIDEKAFESDRKYDENTFVYIGSLHAWQCFEETIEIYKRVEEQSIKPTKLYIYTSEQEKAFQLVKKYHIRNYEISYEAANKIGDRLNKLKYGFVIRNDCIVNNVATPTKLSNYLSHGIIPIYSECLNSFNEFNINSNGYGIICNLDNILEGVERILESTERIYQVKMVKEWCVEAFKSYYFEYGFVKKIVEEIEKIYS